MRDAMPSPRVHWRRRDHASRRQLASALPGEAEARRAPELSGDQRPAVQSGLSGHEYRESRPRTAETNACLLARGVSETASGRLADPIQSPKPARLQLLPKQGRQDSNLQPPVLETGALPIVLLPFGRAIVRGSARSGSRSRRESCRSDPTVGRSATKLCTHRGRSVVVAQKPSKLLGRVRFPSPACCAAGAVSAPGSTPAWRRPAAARAAARSAPPPARACARRSRA